MQRFIAFVSAVFMFGLGVALAPAASAHDPIPGHDITYARWANAPVLFVHGFSQPKLNSACLLSKGPGDNVTTTWTSAISALSSAGYTGAVKAIAYYRCDILGAYGVSIKSYGASAPAYLKSPDNNGLDTKIETFAYELAWYIHDNYSVSYTPVSLVGHSMGGLIIRYMLDRIAAGDPDFPPAIYVQDAVSIATPFDGATPSVVTYLCGPAPVPAECQEFSTGSTFLTTMLAAGTPQATYGTDWTGIGGSPCDTLVAAASSMDNVSAHLLSYYTANPPCYTHASYLTDTSTAADVPIAYMDPGDPYPYYTATGQRSLTQMVKALTSSSW